MDLDVRFELQQISYQLEFGRPRDTGANLTAYLKYLSDKLLAEHDLRYSEVAELATSRISEGWSFRAGDSVVVAHTQRGAIGELFRHLATILERTPYPGPGSSLLQELDLARFISAYDLPWLGSCDPFAWFEWLKKWLKSHEDPRWKRLDNMRSYGATYTELLMSARSFLTDPVSDAYRDIAEEEFRQTREHKEQQERQNRLIEEQAQHLRELESVRAYGYQVLSSQDVWGMPGPATRAVSHPPEPPPEPKQPNRRSIII